jgi:hypothetical protein
MAKHSLSKFRNPPRAPGGKFAKKIPDSPEPLAPTSPQKTPETPALEVREDVAQAVREHNQWTAPPPPPSSPTSSAAPAPENELSNVEGSSHGIDADSAARIAQLNVTEPVALDAAAGAVGDAGGGAVIVPPAGSLNAEQFNGFLAAGFGAAALGCVAVTRNVGFEKLAIGDAERGQFKAFTDSLHHLAVKYPQYFGWLIRPENETIQAAVIIVTFTAGKARMVAAAVQANKPQRPAPAATREEEAARMQ